MLFGSSLRKNELAMDASIQPDNFHDLFDLAKPIVERAATGAIQSLLTRRKSHVDRAIEFTADDFPGVEGIDIALQRLSLSKAFANFLEKVHAGHREPDDEILASFLDEDEGDFYLPDANERISLARDIITKFIQNLATEFYQSDGGLVALANRHEQLISDMKRDFSAEMRTAFQSVKSDLIPIGTDVRTLADSALSVRETDSAHRNSKVKIDLIRDLINQGLVRVARRELRRLQSDLQDIPVALEFRIITNLAACALAEEDLEEACSLFQQAHRLQPENEKAIANASLGSHVRGDSTQAIDLAVKARSLNPQNSQATAVLLREFRNSDKAECIEDLVTREKWISEDRECGLTLAVIWIQQLQYDRAVAICRDLSVAFPDDAHVQLALSRSLGATADAERTYSGELTAEAVIQLSEAEAAATRAIELLEETELLAQRCESIQTRAVIRRLLGSHEEASRDLEDVLSLDPGRPDALFNKGLSHLLQGRPQHARVAFESIQDCEWRANAVLPLAQACLASGDSTEAIRILKGNVSLEAPDWEGIRKAETLLRAEAADEHDESVGPMLDAALQRHPEDPCLLALAAWRCELKDDVEGAEQWLLRALQHADSSERGEIQLELGGFYQKQERFKEAAHQFTEVVGGVAMHAAAVPLLVCLVNSGMLRRALEWARKLRQTHRHVPKVALDAEAQILERVGDIRAAAVCRKELCARSDANAIDRVRLATAHFRLGNRDSATETIDRINTQELADEPSWLLRLAHLRFMLGKSDYLHLAYLARRFGINDPELHGCYVQFFLHSEKKWLEPKTVGTDCSVLLKNESIEQWWHILGAGDQISGSYELTADHELALRLMGLRIGDKVILRQDLEELEYEVAAVQSKYVRAYQETLEEFSTRFPGNQSMSRIPVDDNDFTKILNTVDRRHQFVRETERLYLAGQLPLASFSSFLGLSPIEVWRGCTAIGQTYIRFSTGSIEEANRDAGLLSCTNSIVLELIALLTIHELGISQHLHQRFDQILVPQHVIDELQDALGKAELGPPKAHLGKSGDGTYTLTEVSDDEWNEWCEHIRSILDLAESFHRISSFGLLDVDDVDEQIELLTHAGVGVVYSRDEESKSQSPLVSDDLGMSGVARYLKRGVVNTQTILEELLRSEVITPDQYACWIERLIMLNYRNVRVRPRDIFLRLEKSQYVTTEETRAMIKVLEAPDCSEDCAIAVAASVVNLLATRAPIRQTDLILWTILAALRHGREMGIVLLKFRERVSSELASTPIIRDHAIRTIESFIASNSWTVNSLMSGRVS